ncbi:hypothetical protein [Pseudomonas syringae]|uniref:hypothetical protein n=1 Tax=Pseudomonas syringae TaxID=317 RepID=UPI0012AEBD0E|nr:hypothetical protein [Pseudomonas syringae]
MNKYEISRKENLWLFVIVVGVFSLSNFSVRYPVITVVQIALLTVLIGYLFFRIFQTFKASQGHDESTVEKFQQLMGDPKIVEALEASLNQSRIAEANKSDDEPRLIRALKEVGKQRKG